MGSPALQPWSMQGGATQFTRNEVQAWARKLLTSEAHRTLVEEQILKGTLPTPEKILLYHYAFGKPVEQVQLNVTQGEDLSVLSVPELLRRAQSVAQQLEEAQALASAIPADILQGPWGSNPTP